MLISNARSSIKAMSQYGVLCATVVGMLIAWNTTISLGLAVALALACVVGCFETLAWCVIARAEKEEN